MNNRHGGFKKIKSTESNHEALRLGARSSKVVAVNEIILSPSIPIQAKIACTWVFVDEFGSIFSPSDPKIKIFGNLILFKLLFSKN